MESDRSGALHPARCVCQQPDAVAHPRSAGSQQLSGQHDGTDVEPVLVRFNGTWHAPSASSWRAATRSWRVEQLDRRSTARQQPELAAFGPATVVSSTGSRQSNPLATRIRFVYPTRGEGQVLLAATHTVGASSSASGSSWAAPAISRWRQHPEPAQRRSRHRVRARWRQSPIQHRGLPPAGEPAGRAVVSAGPPVPLLTHEPYCAEEM